MFYIMWYTCWIKRQPVLRETQIKETRGIIILWSCWTFLGKIGRGKDIPLIPRIIKITLLGHTVKEHLVAKCGSDEEKVFKGKRKYHGPNFWNLKKTFWWWWDCCRKVTLCRAWEWPLVLRPLAGPESGLLSNTRKLIMWGDTHADETRDFTGKRQGNPGELLCQLAHSLGFHGDAVSFQTVSGQSFWLRTLPGCARIAQPRWMPVRRILGGGWTRGASFWPFPELFLLVVPYKDLLW